MKFITQSLSYRLTSTLNFANIQIDINQLSLILHAFYFIPVLSFESWILDSSEHPLKINKLANFKIKILRLDFTNMNSSIFELLLIGISSNTSLMHNLVKLRANLEINDTCLKDLLIKYHFNP